MILYQAPVMVPCYLICPQTPLLPHSLTPEFLPSVPLEWVAWISLALSALVGPPRYWILEPVHNSVGPRWMKADEGITSL